MSPEQPHYDLAEFRTLPYHDRVRLACLDWVHCGFGAPTSAYLFYLLKIGLWIGGWILIVRASGMSGGVADWWTTPMAFVKAIAWTMLWLTVAMLLSVLQLPLRATPAIVFLRQTSVLKKQVAR